LNEINTEQFLKRFNSTLFLSLKKLWAYVGLEAFIWICGLLYLIVINIPEATHFTICPISNLGFDFCPGCGLGNSISYLFRGNFEASFYSHPLGFLAFLIILNRIISLLKNNRRRLCKMSYN
jgi:hypothetical protein